MNKLPYIIVHNFLSEEEIDSLMDYWNSLEEVVILEHNDWDTSLNGISDITVKGRKVRITGINKEAFENITSKIQNLFTQVLGDESEIELPHYLTEYKEGCYHSAHRDKLPEMWYRDKVVTVQLSNPNDYDGGELKIGDIVLPKDRGCAVVYNGKDLHEVTKVSRGVRFSLTECAGVKPEMTLL